MIRALLLYLAGVGTGSILARLERHRTPTRYPGEGVRQFRDRQIDGVVMRRWFTAETPAVKRRKARAEELAGVWDA